MVEEISEETGLEIQPTNGISHIHGIPTSQELMVYQTWAKTAVESNMYRGIGKESGVMMIMLAAREYGIGPAQALNGGLNIIEGKVELSSRIMGALIRRAKHIVKILKSTDTKCTIWGKRRDTGEELSVEYTIEMAQRAGLVKDKGGWKKNPEDMLFARAMSRLARQLFSDVIGIGYIEGEISVEPLSCPDISEQKIDEEKELLEQLFSRFEKEDQYLMKEYIKVVSNHFKWDILTSLKELLKDPSKTSEKFNLWKEKRSS